MVRLHDDIGIHENKKDKSDEKDSSNKNLTIANPTASHLFAFA